MYLAITTRPDIQHSISKLVQRKAGPHIQHYQVLKCVFPYLAGTIELKLIHDKNKIDLEGFVDADWGSNNLDRKSYTGFTFYFNRNLVSSILLH